MPLDFYISALLLEYSEWHSRHYVYKSFFAKMKHLLRKPLKISASILAFSYTAEHITKYSLIAMLF